VGGVDVVLTFRIARDRGDLISLDDELGFKLLNGLPGRFGRRLLRIADRK
jgi:hypothetical protein